MKEFVNRHPYLFAFIVLPAALGTLEMVARGWPASAPASPPPGQLPNATQPTDLPETFSGLGYEGYED